jgi:hypothetical protein
VILVSPSGLSRLSDFAYRPSFSLGKIVFIGAFVLEISDYKCGYFIRVPVAIYNRTNSTEVISDTFGRDNVNLSLYSIKHYCLRRMGMWSFSSTHS